MTVQRIFYAYHTSISSCHLHVIVMYYITMTNEYKNKRTYLPMIESLKFQKKCNNSSNIFHNYVLILAQNLFFGK